MKKKKTISIFFSKGAKHVAVDAFVTGILGKMFVGNISDGT